jgi:hypothetical protein
MVPFKVRVPVASEAVFPYGALLLGVEPATEFAAQQPRRGGDDQIRDAETGLRVWAVTVVDLEPTEPGRFRRTSEMKVRVVSDPQPVAPRPMVEGMPPLVSFIGLTMSPWTDRSRCRPEPGVMCRARLEYSLYATGMVAYTPNRNTATATTA